MKKYQMFVDGDWVDPDGGQWTDTVDPYRGEAWAQIPLGNQNDVTRTVSAARRAMTDGPWSSMSASARGKIMRRLGDLVLANADHLAAVEVRDNGKLLAEVNGQLASLADVWYYYAGLADKIQGSTIPIEKSDSVAFTYREPIGVVAALTAWNSPLWFAAVKCAPALAAGCTVIVKPSEFASASTLEFAELTRQAGLPAGVFNVVTGLGPDVGSALVEHPDVAKITFTGSDTTGARVYESAARTMKRVSLELGGKSPNIVFEDADLDKAATGVVSGIFGASGQMCSAGSRLLVHSSIKDAFTEKLVEIARSIRLGDPNDPLTNVGPIATPPQYRKVLDYIDIANAEGARCLLGGKPASGADLTGGQFIEPTIYTDVTNDMRIAQEEVFGPILSIIEFEDEKHAIALGNDVAYGLVAGVWTENVGRALRMSKALDVGTVWVNTYRTYSYMVPFGGTKQSGLGREHGIEAVDGYLDTKSIVISTDDGAPSNAFVMR
ncbi:carnitine dehydratase [Rhodococcus sp. 15-725-2-2b]|jgi:aldehyde dehydrogenase (NAD+)|uniref:aldehyde dehydrogenase n=1 Tax=Nocardiaceae TaxID=85025 RepID=UPI00055DB4C7|nr:MULTISPECIES: aldehyde dehydrogenase [Rhodococcus]OZC61978.1 carnitine dehydratase [Rhodococcus sp. 06-470-2]OZC64523.1 carnitine dehydratase [Rhodococcus sp. 06-469-3-2]OZC88042.1 carnitine dehydratase [Rhodococcus sp. 06-418-1B]OZD51157.1 carnitine dehydratase [Rhodococcus sp. 06-1477-1A]OZE58107.1 carnitine dehydratase [Rhodococcus sp. 05-2221-1B]